MLSILASLALAPAFSLVPQGPAPLASQIQEVTVYRSGARVRRLSDPLEGRAAVVLEGLPGALDPDSVRARCTGGHVVNVEVRARVLAEVPEARIEALRARALELQRANQADDDALVVQEQLAQHLDGWMLRERAAFAAELEQGALAAAEWSERFAFLTERMRANVAAARAIRARQQVRAVELEDLSAELGRSRQGTGVRLHDVHVEVAAARPDARVELDYLVDQAAWEPAYELRTARDARSVSLAYRARVWQRSGEDWKEVRLLLSSAEPQRGAQGPEPRPLKAGVSDPRTVAGSARRPSAGFITEDEASSAMAPPAAAKVPPFAAVLDEGLSVRFEVARPETIESREDPRTVLLARTSLDVGPEYFCAPRLDPTVWLRGVATNTADWPLLAGEAAVHFGDDYLGTARLETVERGQELELHLGPVDGLPVEVVRTGDLTSGPGMFSNARKRSERWRVGIQNLDPPFTDPDGSVRIVVREAIPRSTDGRVKMRLIDVTLAASKDERWRRDREERGIETWVVRVPRDGRVDLGFGLEVSFPEGQTVRVR